MALVCVYILTPTAAFRLACCSPHCCFDDDICTTVQVALAAKGWSAGKQHLANKLRIQPLCPQLSWFIFNLGAMPLFDKDKAAWSLRVTMKRWSWGVAASSKPHVVWSQHKCEGHTALIWVSSKFVKIWLGNSKVTNIRKQIFCFNFVYGSTIQLLSRSISSLLQLCLWTFKYPTHNLCSL